MKWTIRRALPGDGLRLRALRLKALSDVPEAFLETYDQAAGLNAAEWESRIEHYRRPGHQLLVVGEADATWSGMAGAFVDCERDRTDLTIPVRPSKVDLEHARLVPGTHASGRDPGRLVCFGLRPLDFGMRIDPHRIPGSGHAALKHSV
ncbi:hypothetical protein ACIRRA_39800 [Nocardia sp. NPDC101769]|uniref:hypothetical protein n=1 Tax=Nocardia sp. NPDC101769 TaxID=3364333 RepID=UPI00382A7268